jgi:hypothetical protein
VEAAITKLLLPLAADPGGLSNSRKLKNPCSPYWTLATPNEHEFFSLADWAACPNIDLGASKDALLREAVQVKTDLDPVGSNQLFSTGQQLAFGLLRRWHRSGDPENITNLQDRQVLGERLIKELAALILTGCDCAPDQAMAMAKTVGRYAARVWNPARGNGRRCANQGVMQGQFSPEDPLEVRQAAGARRSAQAKRDAALSALVKAYAAAVQAGQPPKKAAVARAAGVNRKTAHRRWAEVLALACGQAP